MSDQFGLENLPYGSFRPSADEPPRLGVAFGEYVVDLAAIADALSEVPRDVICARNLDRLLEAGPATWAALRQGLREVLAAGLPENALIARAEADACLPFTVRDYVDFYSSIEHATNLGRIFRPESEPLLPNWRHLPVGYHGRSSTVVVSGTPIRRPWGQLPSPAGPTQAPTRELDIELELGFVTGGRENALGEAISIDRAAEHIFGFVLVNDWSARDIQRWEYQPLGPCLGKSFATSISPWVVPLAALEPYRVAGPPQSPWPLEYLQTDTPWAFDIEFEILLQPADGPPHAISRTNARSLYWSAAQQLAHITSNGCVVRPGDLYASGTISGGDHGTMGSLIELTWNGERPLDLQGETRSFLEDGDTVTIRGIAGERGSSTVGFGEVCGTVIAT